MSPNPTFHVRGVGEVLEDGQFILGAFDASLHQLAAIGSGGQWGSTPFSERPDTWERIKIEQAKRYQSTGEGEPVRIFIVEAEVPPAAVDELPPSVRIRTDEAGRRLLAVGSVMLSHGMYPHYLGPHFDKEPIKKELDGTSAYVYLEALITDYRAGPWRKGAGAALIEHARRYCLEKSLHILYGDCYAGNDRKLVNYYEGQGFHVVSDFEGPAPDGSIWRGAFFRTDVLA
ncbi:putative kinesin motor domain-containing protein [Rosellinia necatrix]|uniref:Putative kinesin motor domain-containing protein n=1 Tax=Rosellinia necatrix TaxID=77044 RepID=A0A1S7UMI5_ROSNE|nr:putative kinesin motor domain-containing protein [Rosellinia necatrix]